MLCEVQDVFILISLLRGKGQIVHSLFNDEIEIFHHRNLATQKISHSSMLLSMMKMYTKQSVAVVHRSVFKPHSRKLLLEVTNVELHRTRISRQFNS